MTNLDATDLLRITSAPAITLHRRWDLSQALLLAWGHGRDGGEVDELADLVARGLPAAAADLARLV